MSTEYVLLIKQDPGEDTGKKVWREIEGTFSASSARRALAVADVAAGEWVAVPARSWRPLTVQIEKVNKVTIG